VLLREDEEGVLAIGQASHAWISGQLARAWGNAEFGAVEPYEEVCLAAEQHDIGMSRWDLTPSRNPATGLPHSFMEMPVAVHLRLWRAGPRQLVRQSRYAALLTAMHGRRLYEERDLRDRPPREATAIRAFVNQQRRLEEQLLSSLRACAATAPAAAPERVARNSQLIWTWDFLSLALCLNWAPCTAPQVPRADGGVDLHLRLGGHPGQFGLDPWPCEEPQVTVRCEGQRLRGRFDSDGGLEAALDEAPWETLEFQLRPP
jgi:hypothetical protein